MKNTIFSLLKRPDRRLGAISHVWEYTIILLVQKCYTSIKILPLSSIQIKGIKWNNLPDLARMMMKEAAASVSAEGSLKVDMFVLLYGVLA